jgi:hypothetical protein
MRTPPILAVVRSQQRPLATTSSAITITDNRIKGEAVACPFFSPTRRFEGITVPHPARLPLADGWRGICTAPGHHSEEPDEGRLAECCNVGYAKRCSWFPENHSCDAVRFSIARDRGETIQVFYICEVNHRPGLRGSLEFDCARRQWRAPHPDARIQRQAECYLEVYLTRRSQAAEVRT